jgi:hypothetical protein
MLRNSQKQLTLLMRLTAAARSNTIAQQQSVMGPVRMFATKNGNESDGETPPPKKRGRPKKTDVVPEAKAPAKRGRKTKFEVQAEKLEKELMKAEGTIANENPLGEDVPVAPKKALRKKKTAQKSKVTPEEMYTLKFNSPILPYAKFPLT